MHATAARLLARTGDVKLRPDYRGRHGIPTHAVIANTDDAWHRAIAGAFDGVCDDDEHLALAATFRALRCEPSGYRGARAYY